MQLQKFHMQVVPVYFQQFWRNLPLKCVAAKKIAKNSRKSPILRV